MSSQTEAVTSIPLKELAALLGIDPPGEDLEITGVSTIEAAGQGDVTFLANDRYAVKLKDSRAGAVLVAADYEGEAPMPMLRTNKPRLAFAQLLALFHPPRGRTPGIHATAIVPESCTLGVDLAIGAYVVVGENVKLGDRVTLHSHTVVYDDVEIGADSVIHSHVALREGITLGKNVIVQNGAMLGPDGFGFEPDEQGHLQRVPQVGTVEIGDDVDIQANACVDRAALGATVLGTGTKVDNLAQIAHGCTVGEHSVICGQVGLAGSTRVGKRVMLGGQSGCSGHIEIGDGAQVAAQSGVIFDLEAGKSYGGTPAIPFQKALRASLFLGELPTFSRSLKKLQKAVAKIETRLDDAS